MLPTRCIRYVTERVGCSRWQCNASYEREVNEVGTVGIAFAVVGDGCKSAGSKAT